MYFINIIYYHYLNYDGELLPSVAEKTIQVIQGQIFCEEFLKKFLESGVKKWSVEKNSKR